MSQNTELLGKIIHARNRSLIKCDQLWAVSIHINIHIRNFSYHVPSVTHSGSALERAMLNVGIDVMVYLSRGNIHKFDRLTRKNKLNYIILNIFGGGHVCISNDYCCCCHRPPPPQMSLSLLLLRLLLFSCWYLEVVVIIAHQKLIAFFIIHFRKHTKSYAFRQILTPALMQMLLLCLFCLSGRVWLQQSSQQEQHKAPSSQWQQILLPMVTSGRVCNCCV